MPESYTPREFIDKINSESSGPTFDPYVVEGLMRRQQEGSAAADLLASAKKDLAMSREKQQTIEDLRKQADDILDHLKNAADNLANSQVGVLGRDNIWFDFNVEIYKANGDPLLRDELIRKNEDILTHSNSNAIRFDRIENFLDALTEKDEMILGREIVDSTYLSFHPRIDLRPDFAAQIAKKGDIENALLLAETIESRDSKDYVYSKIAVELIKENDKTRALELTEKIYSKRWKSKTFTEFYRTTGDIDYITVAEEFANDKSLSDVYKIDSFLDIYVAKKDKKYLDDVLFYCNTLKNVAREYALRTIGEELAQNDFIDDALDVMSEIVDDKMYKKVYAEIAKSFARNGEAEKAENMLKNISTSSYLTKTLTLEIIKCYMSQGDLDNAKRIAGDVTDYKAYPEAWAVIAKSLYEKANNLEGSLKA